MTLLSERYKNDITVREQQKGNECPRNNKKEISVREIKKTQHYYRRDKNMTLLSAK